MQVKPKQPAFNRSALLLTVTLITSISVLLWGGYLWLKNDESSALAERVRELIGIASSHSKPSEAEPASVEVTADDEAAPIAVKAEPEPLPKPLLTWKEFISKRSMWPSELEIVIDQQIPIKYRNNRYGEMVFEPGQIISVYDLTDDGRVLGSINENELLVPASATNILTWFKATHGESEDLQTPTAIVHREASSSSDGTDDEIHRQLRIWTLRNYDTPLVDIEEDGIVLNWSPADESIVDFRFEAREIARRYLMIQSEYGGRDNYASCRILDRETGELLGTNGIFIPRL